MSEEVTSGRISAEDQIASHVRENYESVRIERGLTWKQMHDQFSKDRNGEILAAWALERHEAEESGTPIKGIESRGEFSEEKVTADAPAKSARKKGNAPDLEPDAE